MGVASNSLNGLGLILLIHAVYSAYEVSIVLPTTSPNPSPSSSSPDPIAASSSSSHASLPTDIVLETLISVLILCLGIVLSSHDLKPIQWRVWAGRLEKEKGRVMTSLDEGVCEGYNPFMALEERSGFVDIRKRRGEFLKWVQEGDRTKN